MKLLLRLALVLVALLVVAAIGVAVFFDPLVKSAIELGGSYAFETPVRAGSVAASPFSGSFELGELAVDNPKGFRPEPFLAIGSASAKWDEGSVLSSRLVIDEFRIEGLNLNLERGANGSNFGVLLDSLGRLSSKSASPDKGGAGSSGGSAAPERHLEIRRIVLRDVRAACHVSLLGTEAPTAQLTVPEVVIENFSTDGSTTEIVARLFESIVRAALESTLRDGSGLPAAFAGDLRGKLEGLREQMKGQVEERLKGAVQDVGGALQEAGKGLENLLKKPK